MGLGNTRKLTETGELPKYLLSLHYGVVECGLIHVLELLPSNDMQVPELAHELEASGGHSSGHSLEERASMQVRFVGMRWSRPRYLAISMTRDVLQDAPDCPTIAGPDTFQFGESRTQLLQRSIKTRPARARQQAVALRIPSVFPLIHLKHHWHSGFLSPS